MVTPARLSGNLRVSEITSKLGHTLKHVAYLLLFSDVLGDYSINYKNYVVSHGVKDTQHNQCLSSEP